MHSLCRHAIDWKSQASSSGRASDSESECSRFKSGAETILLSTRVAAVFQISHYAKGQRLQAFKVMPVAKQPPLSTRVMPITLHHAIEWKLQAHCDCRFESCRGLHMAA